MIFLLNKKGQLFSVYLFLIVVFMCGVVVSFYYFQNLQYETTASSIVSPKKVMDFRDDLEIYSYLEENYILESLKNSKGEFGSPEFRDSFREEFLQRTESDLFIKEFLVSDLTLGGRDVEEIATRDYSDFLRNTLYSSDLMVFEGNKLFVGRASIGKAKTLYAKENNKINFPVEFKVSFEEKYLISFEDNKYKINKGK